MQSELLPTWVVALAQQGLSDRPLLGGSLGYLSPCHLAYRDLQLDDSPSSFLLEVATHVGSHVCRDKMRGHVSEKLLSCSMGCGM